MGGAGGGSASAVLPDVTKRGRGQPPERRAALMLRLPNAPSVAHAGRGEAWASAWLADQIVENIDVGGRISHPERVSRRMRQAREI